MIKLPSNKVREWVKFQVYYRDHNIRQWRKIETMGTDGGGFPFSNVQNAQRGIYVSSVSRVAIPNFGTATLEMPIGNINTVNYNFKNNEVTALDLKGAEIYITGTHEDGTTSVCFWGVVDYQKDDLTPSASPHIIGKRIYKASDLLYYTAYRAELNKHGYATENYVINRAEGMPYYNGRVGRDDLKQGNKATQSAIAVQDRTEPMELRDGGLIDLQRFTFDSTGSLWNDAEVVLHAIHNGQRKGQLIEFTLVDDANLLGRQNNQWQVSDNERAWNFIRKILKFQRGAGVSVFDWDTNADGEPTNPKIVVHPLETDEQTITLPDGSSEVIAGADDIINATIDVDLIGDHRSVDASFRLGGVEDYTYQRIEVVGEKIQVMCTLETDAGSLAKLWTDSDKTAFDALSDDDADPQTYDHVLRLFGIPRDWNGVTFNGNGNAGEPNSIYYYCNDQGEVKFANDGSGSLPRCSPSLLRILPALPLHDGIDPITGDSINADDQKGVTARQRLLAYQAEGTDDFNLLSVVPRMRSDGVWLGSRTVDTSKARPIGVGDMADFDDELVMITGIELPHRVHVARGASSSAATNTKRIKLSGQHLWIGAAGSIYKITDSGDVTRFPETTLIRDDRTAISYVANLAAHWYLETHRTATWALRDFCIGGSYRAEVIDSENTGAKMHDDDGRSIPITTSDGGTDIAYPKIGQIVKTLKAFSSDNIINAPVTMIRYDNASGVTTFGCDWGELEI